MKKEVKKLKKEVEVLKSANERLKMLLDSEKKENDFIDFLKSILQGKEPIQTRAVPPIESISRGSRAVPPIESITK